MRSILQNEKECFICGSQRNLELHHVMGGANRKNSTEYGLTVWLCHNCHNEPPRGVHHNRANELRLKKHSQETFEAIHGHEKWMSVFGRSYL